jgi:signal transduction histidine kinase
MVAEHTHPVRHPGGDDRRQASSMPLTAAPPTHAIAAVAAGALAVFTLIVVPGGRTPLETWAYALAMASLAAMAWRRAARSAASTGPRWGPWRRPSLLGGGRGVVGASLSRLVRVVDLRVVLMLAWTSWLAVPWVPGVLAPPEAAVVEPSHDLVARAALAERTRIAGEVHDVAGHGLAAIAMQAGVALLMLEERPEQARESLEAIRTTSMRALTELRIALDGIHPHPPGTEPAGDVAAAPRAGPPDLNGLIGNVRAAGLPVDLELGQPPGAMPADVGDLVYRVVRESLTNVLRHAGPTRAVVRVAHEPGGLVVEVADRGRGSPAGAAPSGRGLAVMRTRVEAAGGVLTAGPREGGGFRVTARLPAGAA